MPDWKNADRSRVTKVMKPVQSLCIASKVTDDSIKSLGRCIDVEILLTWNDFVLQKSKYFQVLMNNAPCIGLVKISLSSHFVHILFSYEFVYSCGWHKIAVKWKFHLKCFALLIGTCYRNLTSKNAIFVVPCQN